MQINKVAEARNVHTIRELVDSFSGEAGRHPALNIRVGDSFRTMSYEDLGRKVRALGNGLLELGVGKGEHVGLIGENRSEWITAYLAVAAVGAVVVPFDILLKRDELLNVVKASEARLVFVTQEHLAKMESVRPEAPALRRLVLFDGAGGAGESGDIGYQALLSLGERAALEGADRYASTSVKPDDLAALLFTSGTTGVPKGVMLSHGALMANADAVQMTTVLGPTDNWIVVLPLHHTYPTMMGILVPLVTSGLITPVPTLKASVLIQTMKDTQPTAIPAIPALVEKLYKSVLHGVRAKPLMVRIGFHFLSGVSRFLYRAFGLRVGKSLLKSVAHQMGLDRLRFFISGGGPIAKEIIDGMNVLGLGVFQGYGLTETSPVISSACPAHDRPGSVGLPLANLEVRIGDPDRDGNGEILVRGPSLMQGYWGMPEKTREVIDQDGWLHTGDIGCRDGDGYLYVTGRIKNIIVTSGGKKIYPEEIENALLQSPYIAQALVVGREDKQRGEHVYAVVYPNAEGVEALEKEQGRRLDPEQLRELLKREIRAHTRGLASYKVPEGFEVSSDELPKTTKNTVKRYLFAKR